MLPLEVLIPKFLAINTLPTCSISPREITALEHELRNDAMEFAAFIAEALLACAESTEVLSRFGNHVVVEVEFDAAFARCRGGVSVEDLRSKW